jgi:hypothetical protein
VTFSHLQSVFVGLVSLDMELLVTGNVHEASVNFPQGFFQDTDVPFVDDVNEWIFIMVEVKAHLPLAACGEADVDVADPVAF